MNVPTFAKFVYILPREFIRSESRPARRAYHVRPADYGLSSRVSRTTRFTSRPSRRNLNPALFPHDAEFFRLQFQATIFDKLVAFSVRLTHLPLAWTVLLWQVAAIFLLLHGCWRISRRCFTQPAAQWASVTTVAALLTLPLPGIAISLADQYLHPRTLATAAILAAIVAVLDRRLWLAGVLLAIAFSIHAIMASFGISFCAFLFWNQRVAADRRSSVPLAVAMVLPLGWIFEPASDAWRQAAATRGFYYPARWHWYEWLGLIAPLILLCSYWMFLKRGERSGSDGKALRSLVRSLLYYGLFQTAAGLLIMLPPSLERLRPFEPMRYLHLLYLLFFLVAGGLMGRYVLDRRVYRWLLLFLPLSAGMFYAQRQTYPASAHLELPGIAPQNDWLRAFAWIRQNTPVDSLFALDPHYMSIARRGLSRIPRPRRTKCTRRLRKRCRHGCPRSAPGPALAEGSECAKRLAKFSSRRFPAPEAGLRRDLGDPLRTRRTPRHNDLPISKRSASSVPTILRKRRPKK